MTSESAVDIRTDLAATNGKARASSDKKAGARRSHSDPSSRQRPGESRQRQGESRRGSRLGRWVGLVSIVTTITAVSAVIAWASWSGRLKVDLERIDSNGAGVGGGLLERLRRRR